MKIVPMGDRVLVAEEKAAKTTAMGIIIEGSIDETKIYLVMDVGPDVTQFTEGERVLIDLAKVKVVKLAGELRALVAQDDILAKVEV